MEAPDFPGPFSLLCRIRTGSWGNRRRWNSV